MLHFNRCCGLQVHHEILNLKNCGNFTIAVSASDDGDASEPKPSTDYWIEFPATLYDPNHIATRIAERLKNEHGIDSIVERLRRSDGGDDEPRNRVLAPAR